MNTRTVLSDVMFSFSSKHHSSGSTKHTKKTYCCLIELLFITPSLTAVHDVSADIVLHVTSHFSDISHWHGTTARRSRHGGCTNDCLPTCSAVHDISRTFHASRFFIVIIIIICRITYDRRARSASGREIRSSSDWADERRGFP